MSRKQERERGERAERENRAERRTGKDPENLDGLESDCERDEATEHYEVGYGKPPKHGQFQKGNKLGKGRPKRSKNMKTLVTEAANDKAPVKINGKVKKVAKGELTVKQVFTKGAAGDPKFVGKAIELQERYLAQEEAPSTVPPPGDPDVETMRNYLAWHDQLHGSNDNEQGRDEG